MHRSGGLPAAATSASCVVKGVEYESKETLPRLALQRKTTDTALLAPAPATRLKRRQRERERGSRRTRPAVSMAPGAMSNVDVIETGCQRGSSFLSGIKGSHQAYSQQQRHTQDNAETGTAAAAPAAAAPPAAIRSPLETSRTQSQSSDGRSFWHREQTASGEGFAEGFAGEMDGAGAGPARREEISFNLSLSEFPHLAFLAQVHLF